MSTAGRVTACKAPGCGQMIRWLFTEARKRIPLDPDPHPDGTVVLVKVGHETLARVLTGAQLPAQETAYRAHWATCPGSDAMRAKKAREAARGPLCGGCGSAMPADLAGLEHWEFHPCCDPRYRRPAARRRAGAA